MLVVDIGGGTTDCSLLLMGPQWRSRLDREASLLGHSGCRIGGNDLDIALAFKNLMPLLGMGGETEKASPCRFCRGGMRLPSTTYLRKVISTVVPTVACLTIWYAMPANRKKVALLQKVWRQRLSYRTVRSAEESKIALSSVAKPAPHCRLSAMNWLR